MIFEGWYEDVDFEKEFKFSRRIKEDLTLHAKYTVDYELLNSKINNADATNVMPRSRRNYKELARR